VSSLPDAGIGGRPRAGAILVACVVGFLAGEILASVLIMIGVALTHFPGGFSALAHASQPPWWANVLSLVGLWTGFAGAIYFALARGGLRPLADQWRLRGGDVRYVLLGAGCQAVVAVAYYPFHLKNLNKPVNHLFGDAHGWGLVVIGVLTTLVAPLLEEWFFRGVLFRALREGLASFGSTLASVGAVVVSAVLFALAHGEPLQFAGLAFVGIVLAVLVLRTRRLMPSVITHISFNAVAMVALLAQRSGR
jgi:membrane protease YdiL (CAAX protease family)